MMISSRSRCGSFQRTVVLLAFIVFLCVWFWSHRPTVVYYSTSDSEETAGSNQFLHSVLRLHMYSKDDPLVHLRQSLTFKNYRYGIVKQSIRYVWNTCLCVYLELQNVSGPHSWADLDKCNYLFHDVSGDLKAPPSGMRSSVPLGGEGAVRCICVIWLSLLLSW